MFAYGRGTGNRTLINRLKAYYFAVKLYPRHLITLVTGHDRSPLKKLATIFVILTQANDDSLRLVATNLVASTRIELVIKAYQASVIPFN